MVRKANIQKRGCCIQKRYHENMNISLIEINSNEVTKKPSKIKC